MAIGVVRRTHAAAAGNPLSERQLMARFALTRAAAARVRHAVPAEANGGP
jgi:hypothetical protein